MSAKGYNKTYIAMPSQSFNADQSMDAYRSWNCLHNLQHLIDSSGQYRVNTVALFGGALFTHGLVDGNAPPPASMSWEFPLTMMHAEHPPHFDVRVAARVNDDAEDDATVIASVNALHDNRDLFGGASPIGLYFKSASVSSETASWVIDEQKTWGTPTNDYMRMLRGYYVTENGGSAGVRLVMVRLTVAIRIANTASEDAHIVGVQFREYA